jgi:predicted nucleic acid-binding protein
MIVLDTTVLVYGKGAEHELRNPCRELLWGIAEGRVRAATTIEVIQEFTHVRARRRGATDAVALARDYLELLSPLLILRPSDLDRALSLFEKHPQLGAFGALLASAAISAEADWLVSADQAFSAVPNLPHVVPDQLGIGNILVKKD